MAISTGLWNLDSTGAGGGVSYDPAAAAFFASLSVQPSSAEKTLYNDMIAGIRADGYLSRLLYLRVYAAPTAEAARTNIITPGTYNAAPVSSPTFTAYVGYAGNGVSSYLDTNFSQMNYPQNDNCQVIVSAGTGVSTSVITGANRNLISPQNTLGNIRFRNMTSTSSDKALPANTARYMSGSDRRSSTEYWGYRDGNVLAGSLAVASTVAVAQNVYEGCFNNSGSASSFSADTIIAAYGGQSLGDAGQAAVWARVKTFLNGVGYSIP